MRTPVKLNGKLTAPELRIIGEDGRQLGVIRLSDALQLAKSKGLDLVEIAPAAKPPVNRLVDYGKFCHEQQQKKTE